MEIPETLIEYIREEARRIGYGSIIIEIVEERGKVDVVTQRRKRFPVNEPRKAKSSTSREYRSG